MATSNFRQYAPPEGNNQFLDQPLSLIQPYENQLANQRGGIFQANGMNTGDIRTAAVDRGLGNNQAKFSLNGPTSPLSSIIMGGGAGQGAGLPGGKPKLWERGGGKELVNQGLTKLLGKGMMTKGGGLAGKMASKGGLLGKLGKGAASSPTPWMLGGTAAGVLGDFIAKKKAKTGGAIGGAGKGAATGAMIGSVIPGIGTAIGGVAGGLIGGIKGFFGGKKKLKEQRIAEGKDPKTGKPLAGGPPGLTAIGGNGNKYGQNPSGALGRVVGSDPYGQLRAETEARYRPLDTPYTPFMPMPMLGGTQPFKVSTNPWDGGGDALGGQSTYGG
jgi:hypothetical protein